MGYVALNRRLHVHLIPELRHTRFRQEDQQRIAVFLHRRGLAVFVFHQTALIVERLVYPDDGTAENGGAYHVVRLRLGLLIAHAKRLVVFLPAVDGRTLYPGHTARGGEVGRLREVFQEYRLRGFTLCGGQALAAPSFFRRCCVIHGFVANHQGAPVHAGF